MKYIYQIDAMIPRLNIHIDEGVVEVEASSYAKGCIGMTFVFSNRKDAEAYRDSDFPESTITEQEVSHVVK